MVPLRLGEAASLVPRHLDFVAGLPGNPVVAATRGQSRRTEERNGAAWSLASRPGFRTRPLRSLTVMTDTDCLASPSRASHLCHGGDSSLHLPRRTGGLEDRRHMKNLARGLAKFMVSTREQLAAFTGKGNSVNRQKQNTYQKSMIWPFS